tara:strand:- start:2858 stop:3148 length:291 start_codon:yes stop_codon:yes gene_type:complete
MSKEINKLMDKIRKYASIREWAMAPPFQLDARGPTIKESDRLLKEIEGDIESLLEGRDHAVKALSLELVRAQERISRGLGREEKWDRMWQRLGNKK